MGSSLRLFVGMRLDDAAHGRVAEIARRARAQVERQGLRAAWVAPESLHLTLKFLGSVAPDRVDAIAGVLAGAAPRGGAIEAALPGLGTFPSVLFQMVEDGGSLARLAAAVDEALAPLGFVPESRPFHAHVTLARFRRTRRRGARRPRLPTGDFHAGDAAFREVSLFRSETGPGGSRYTALASFAS